MEEGNGRTTNFILVSTCHEKYAVMIVVQNSHLAFNCSKVFLILLFRLARAIIGTRSYICTARLNSPGRLPLAVQSLCSGNLHVDISRLIRSDSHGGRL